MTQLNKRHPGKDATRSWERVLTDREIRLNGQPVNLRLIGPNDTDLWTEFVNGCSAESLWFRFLSPFTATPEMAQRFCGIDPEEELAVVAETRENGCRKLIGIARLIKVPGHDDAEYAIIISDPWQKKSLGRILTERCVELARQWGVKVIHSESLRENFPMTKILHNCRFHLYGKEANILLMSRDLTEETGTEFRSHT